MEAYLGSLVLEDGDHGDGAWSAPLQGLFSLRRFDEFAKINEKDEKGRGGVFDPMASMANPFYISSSSKWTRKASVFTPNNLAQLSRVRSIGPMAPTIVDVHLGNQSYHCGKDVVVYLDHKPFQFLTTQYKL